jgi:hypothetical protein
VRGARGDTDVVTERGARPPNATDASSDLFRLLEAYERSVILAALGAVGGRQRSAAALLRILPSTLCQKMKRLGIGPHRIHRPPAAGGDELCASLLRVEAGAEGRVEVEAVRRGSRAILSAIEVKIVEHSRGITVCALCHGPAEPSPHLDRSLSLGLAHARVDILARVPPDARVVASTVNDDVLVVGVANVEAGTANGRVRLQALPSPPAEVAVKTSPEARPVAERPVA